MQYTVQFPTYPIVERIFDQINPLRLNRGAMVLTAALVAIGTIALIGHFLPQTGLNFMPSYASLAITGAGLLLFTIACVKHYQNTPAKKSIKQTSYTLTQRTLAVKNRLEQIKDPKERSKNQKIFDEIIKVISKTPIVFDNSFDHHNFFYKLSIIGKLLVTDTKDLWMGFLKELDHREVFYSKGNATEGFELNCSFQTALPIGEDFKLTARPIDRNNKQEMNGLRYLVLESTGNTYDVEKSYGINDTPYGVFDQDNRLVASVYIRTEDRGYFFHTLGKRAGFTGKGITEALFKACFPDTNKPIYCQVLKANVAARKVYKMMGMEVDFTYNPLNPYYTMKRPRPPLAQGS